MTKRVLNRMKREKNEIYRRLKKLNNFMASAEFKKLSHTEKSMLDSQRHAMTVYGFVLHDRIAFYEGEPMIFMWRCNNEC